MPCRLAVENTVLVANGLTSEAERISQVYKQKIGPNTHLFGKNAYVACFNLHILSFASDFSEKSEHTVNFCCCSAL